MFNLFELKLFKEREPRWRSVCNFIFLWRTVASCVCGVLVGAADWKDLLLKKIWTGKKKENHKTLKEIWKNKCGYLYVGLLSAELWESIHLSSQKYKFRYSTITSEAMEVNATHPRKQLLFPRICPTPFRLSSSLADLLSRERAINSVAPWTKDLKAGH